MVAKPTWDLYNENCILPKKPTSLEQCEDLFMILYLQVGRNINPYAIDYPVCTEDSMVRHGRVLVSTTYCTYVVFVPSLNCSMHSVLSLVLTIRVHI